jgi:hypothetical protein
VSVENVAKVRRIYAAFGARDWDAGFALTAEDVEWLRFCHLWRFRDGKVEWVYDCAGESARP